MPNRPIPWCSIESVLQIANAKWTVPILRALSHGKQRPSELKRALKDINPKILSERLQDLEKWELVGRKEYKEIPPRVEYSLTTKGQEFVQLLATVRDLGNKWKQQNDGAFPTHNPKECIYCSNGNEESQDLLVKEEADTIYQIDKIAKVYLVGAGPGAEDLITLRGAKLLSEADMVLYSGLRVPMALLNHCSAQAQLMDIDDYVTLDQRQYYLYAKEKGLNIVRLIPGDPAFFDVLLEHIQILEELGVEYEIVPGIPLFIGATSTIGCSLTRHDTTPTVIYTRLVSRAARDSDYDKLEELAAFKTTMCLYLRGADHLSRVVASLSKHYPGQTPVALFTHQPEERHLTSTLEKVVEEVNAKDWRLLNVMLVGDILEAHKQSNKMLQIS